MSKKPLIFLCDDKPKWTKLFGGRHGLGMNIVDEKDPQASSVEPTGTEIGWGGDDVDVFEGSSGEYTVMTLNQSRHFSQILDALKKRGKKPDIVLIDLYHPNDKTPEREKEGSDAIKALTEAILSAKGAIDAAWSREGLTMLERTRRLLPDTPIAIYTELGVALASKGDDDDLWGHLFSQHAEWFVKRDKGREDLQLRSMLEAKKQSDRRCLITFVAFLVLAVILLFTPLWGYFVCGKELDVCQDSIGPVTSALFSVIVPYIQWGKMLPWRK